MERGMGEVVELGSWIWEIVLCAFVQHDLIKYYELKAF